MESEGCILCVGRNRRNQELLSQVLGKAGYGIKVALSYEDVMPMVEASSVVLVLLDVTGFDDKVWQLCELLQSTYGEAVSKEKAGAVRSRPVPFFIITAPNRAHLPNQYGTSGSRVPLLVKPLSIRPLLTLIAHTLQLQP
ncbi:MAG: hypothetical protein WBA76_11260 [Phormidesmis sp.]